jgi:hypothetical protein
LPDPADRIRLEPRAAPAAKPRWAPPRLDRRTVAGAALAAMMIGIVVNAVALQHGRRLDLGPDPAAVASVGPVRTPATPVAAPSPVPEPQHLLATTADLATAAESEDSIATFLHTQTADKRRLTLAAQAALAQLGFAVKSTGAIDTPTRKALIAFEKSHHIAASTVITAKLVHSLKAAEATD